MNVFKSLDAIFPTGAMRKFGEVVTVGISIVLDGVELGEFSMKRKSGHVNASVNAFHMHRGLVRDFTDLVRGSDLSQKQMRRAKRLIALAVLVGYLHNRETDEQYATFYVHIGTPPHGSVAMWWEAAGYMRGDFREVTDKDLSLETLVDIGVIEVVRRLRAAEQHTEENSPLRIEGVSSAR